MLSPGHDIAIVLINSLQLWSQAYDQANKTREKFQEAELVGYVSDKKM